MGMVDLYKDWTPQMVALLISDNRGKFPRSKDYYEKISRYWNNLTKEEKRERTRRMREANKLSWASLDEEAKQKRLKGSFLSLEAQRKSNIGKSERMKKVWAAYTPEERKARLDRSHTSESNEKRSETMKRSRREESNEVKLSRASKLSLALKKFYEDLPEEEKVRRSIQTSDTTSKQMASLDLEGRRKQTAGFRQGARKWWISLTGEEKENFLKRSFHSDSAALARSLSTKLKPNGPERFLRYYLEDKFPSRWAYNGDGSQKILLGRRTPDFVRLDGIKEVVEVMGFYWHPLGDEADKISHYAKYGYKCIVIWEWDCYSFKALDKIFGRE
jgi:hypothetical protein